MRRRMEVLRLPAVPLRHAGYLHPPSADPQWDRTPQAVGVGPGNQAYAVWASRDGSGQRLVTIHDGDRQPVRSVRLDGRLDPSFVQPLPDGCVLLVKARSRSGANAEIWSPDGDRVRQGGFGDAIETVLTTPSGAIWVGYFDEAMGGHGPQGHGLARFPLDLEPAWVYPHRADLPSIADCYALNLAGETAWSCAYTAFHLVAVRDDQPIDYGAAPCNGAPALLTDGATGALIGGYGPEYDLITPFHIGEEHVTAVGGPRRLVLPDGLEVSARRIYGRGTELHVIVQQSWYRLDLAQLVESMRPAGWPTQPDADQRRPGGE
ncbi:hypothetical protein IW249_006222 [Micromonospora vinacea]|uniref:Uncharacterized protein n=1 Tax=Micromonospora vinacea TaxID=709878 RepID=A0ABS0KAZ8_9ACTN|nr:hypothetical protein [Micromonospora vinacea]MBG6105808.1 hypothetical protein [Micromonospora vinacea]